MPTQSRVDLVLCPLLSLLDMHALWKQTVLWGVTGFARPHGPGQARQVLAWGGDDTVSHEGRAAQLQYSSSSIHFFASVNVLASTPFSARELDDVCEWRGIRR